MVKFSKLILITWLCSNSLACIKPLLSRKESSTLQASNHQRLGFRFERMADGILVVDVVDGMGAAVSGLKPGDIVWTANGETGEGLVNVLQDRSVEYVQMEVQPCWSTTRRTLVVQRGIGSGIASPHVQPLLKLAATGNLDAAKIHLQTESFQSEDVVTALRLVERNFPQSYSKWLDSVRDLVPPNTITLEALMRGYNAQHQFLNTVEIYDEWQERIGWDVWNHRGPVYTYANLEIERELLRALIQSDQKDRAFKRMRELQHWHVDSRLEVIVGMAPRQDANIIWSDRDSPFAKISGLDVRGEAWSIDDKPWTVLAFWATWCAPCKKELPELSSWAKSRQDVNVLAVNVDDNLDSKGVVKALQKLDASGLIGVQNKQLINQVNVEAIPTLVLLDSNGVERYRMIGYSPATIAELEERLTAVAPRIQLAQVRNLEADWYPKPSVKDVLYDGQQWWILEEQTIKTVSSLKGWLTRTDLESKIIDKVADGYPADRLMMLNGKVCSRHNKGRVLRCLTTESFRVLSASEPIENIIAAEGKIWGWGESTMEYVLLEQDLQQEYTNYQTSFNVPIQHLDELPFYLDTSMLEFVSMESVKLTLSEQRHNVRSFSNGALLGHSTIDFIKTDDVQWFLRSHPLSKDTLSYSLIALDDDDQLLGALTIRSATKPKLVADLDEGSMLQDVAENIENGQGLWVMIPEQGLMYIQMANLQKTHP